MIANLVKFLLVIVLLLLPPLFMGKPQKEITFNQTTILNLDREYGNLTLSERVQSWLSQYSELIRSLIRKPPASYEFEDPASMLAFVVSRIPLFAIVQPTEDYYYFTIPTATGLLSGNLRLVDVDKNKITLGYFDRQEPTKYKRLGLTEADGISSTMISPSLALVSFAGTQVLFSLPHQYSGKIDNLSEDLQKQFVSKVRDESGIRFLMLYNPERHYFYYFLDPEFKPYEKLRVLSPELVVGERSGFVFYRARDGQYLLLSGVSGKNVEANSFYDGPFDQVPPHLQLRDMIYASYPYLKLTGTDPYGNFCTSHAMRAAISPYYNYAEPEDMLDIYKRCINGTINETNLWECMAYDEKRDFHHQSKAFAADGSLLNGATAAGCLEPQ